MQSETSSSVVTTDAPGQSVPDPFPERFWLWRVIIGFFTGIWNLIQSAVVYVIILGVGVSLLASWLTSQDTANPTTWRVSEYVSSLGRHLLVGGSVFFILVCVAFASRQASITSKRWKLEGEKRRHDEEEKRQAEEQRQRIEKATESAVENVDAKREGSLALAAYDPIQMSSLKPSNCGVKSTNFLRDVYVERDADVQARKTLHELANRAVGVRDTVAENVIGILLEGPHNSGKSRLAWEALSRHLPELQSWYFVQWPLEDRQFPFERMKGQRVVVLLDPLEGYAASKSVCRRLNALQRRFAEAKVPLIVIATYQGEDQKVPEELETLLASLMEIRLDSLDSEQEEKLADDLKQWGIQPKVSDGTPGSMVVGRKTDDDYNTLQPDAQQVMKAVKLFASVSIGTGTVYVTQARVRAVTSALFDVPRLRWRAATDELIRKDFVSGQLVAPSYERVISASTEDVLAVLSDYPLDRDEDTIQLEDWPLLHEVLIETADAEALVALGVAWRDSTLPIRNPNAPSKLDNLRRAAGCFRTAIEVRYSVERETNPSDWAWVEWNLAGVLEEQNFYMQTTSESPTRLEVLQESAEAYRSAREYFTFDEDRENWIHLTSSLARTLNEQAKFLEGAAKMERLEEARQLGENASAAMTPQPSPDTASEVQTTLAYIYLDRAQVAGTPDEAATLEARAFECATASLRILQESGDEKGLDKDALASAQTTLGRIMRFQASLASGEARANLLTKVQALLHETLDALPEADAKTLQTRIWTESVLAETLLQQARGAATVTEKQQYLTEAETLSREVIGTPASWNQPESLAWILGVYAGVLAQQAVFAEKQEQEELLNEAQYYCSSALDVPNRESVPEDWAGTRYTAAVVSLYSARFLGGRQDSDPCSSLDQARQYLTEALDVYRRPTYTAEYQQALALREEIETSVKDLGCSS